MKRATIYRRANGWFLHATSKTIDGLGVATPPEISLGVDASCDALGSAVVEALNGSRSAIPRPTVTELECGFKSMLELAGVKTWTAFARRACSVSVQADDDSEWLTIEPWENAGPKNGFVPMPRVTERVRADAPVTEIGEAIQTAIRLCVPHFE